MNDIEWSGDSIYLMLISIGIIISIIIENIIISIQWTRMIIRTSHTYIYIHTYRDCTHKPGAITVKANACIHVTMYIYIVYIYK